MIPFIAALVMAFSISASNMESTTPNSQVLALGEKAWYTEHQENPGLRPILTIVDFSKADNTERLWVIDMHTNRILYSSVVAHGTNSGGVYSTSFSNAPNSLKSSLGVYVTGDTYYGHAGLSLHIHGLEPGYNSNAFDRHIVVHGAWYSNPDHMGHSWGCFAVPRYLAEPIINTIKNNTLIFAYYPDPTYLHNSRFLNG
jgi:hypothetical protein